MTYRLTRRPFILWNVALFVFFFVMVQMTDSVDSGFDGVFSAIFLALKLMSAPFTPGVGGLVILVVATLANMLMMVGRLNDCDRSRWWCLVALVPGIDLVMSLYLSIEPGVGRGIVVVEARG
jgi:uncharacterized membrane protein YhaH (DUF805 family)